MGSGGRALFGTLVPIAAFALVALAVKTALLIAGLGGAAAGIAVTSVKGSPVPSHY